MTLAEVPSMEPIQGRSDVGQSVAPFERTPSSPFTPGVFGALVGLLMGAPVGWVTCWLVGEIDYLWHGTVLGALIGTVGGIFIGRRQGERELELLQSDIGTIICVLFPLLPALLLLLAGFGMIGGLFFGKIGLGVAFALPMAGLLIGGLLDRFYESILRRRQSMAPSMAFCEWNQCGRAASPRLRSGKLSVLQRTAPILQLS